MKAAITGLGWVTPLGRDLDAVWQAIRQKQFLEPSRLENPVSGKSFFVLRVPEDSLRDTASIPRLRRSSAISHFAVAAALDAARNAGLDPEQLARTALVFAASDGGVIYTRRFFADVVDRGAGAGSPLLFPETVYNAPASHIASRLGLDGEVITLVGDAATGAVRTGCELLAAGAADYCLVVAAQELDWVTCEAYGRWGLVRADTGGKPGAIFSEGAAAIVLARKGGCQVQAAPGDSYLTETDAGARLDALIAGLISTPAPDVVISSASGTRLDEVERKIIARRLPDAKIMAPKLVLGEALACSAIQQIIAGVLALKEPGAGGALVPAIGFNGQISSLFLTEGDQQA